jgi:hypothetical protein
MVALVGGGDPRTSVTGCGVVPMYGVTVYFVMPLPPFAGAVQLTVADAFPALALTPLGAPGAVGPVGVAALEAVEAGPVPTALVAVTVKVYVVPFVKPVMVAVVGGGDPSTSVPGWAVLPT